MLPAKRETRTARSRATRRDTGIIIAMLAVAFLGLLVCGRLLEFVAPSGSVTFALPKMSFLPELSALAALVLLAVGIGLHGWTKLAPRRAPRPRTRPVSGSNVVQFPRSNPVPRNGRVGR